MIRIHLLLVLCFTLLSIHKTQAACKSGCKLAYASYHVPQNSNLPFSCDCLNGDFLGHTFLYTTQPGDTYHNVASLVFVNLTTEKWIQRVNHYDPNNVPDGVAINVTVNCSCGDADVSKEYGLFATYPLGAGDNMSSVAAEYGVPEALVFG